MYSPSSPRGIQYIGLTEMSSKGKQKQKQASKKRSTKKQASSLVALLRTYPLSRDTTFLPMGLPEKIRMPLRYSTRVPMDSDIDSDDVFAMNGVYDPDITQAGHQPRLFDQLMGLYQRYRVIKSAISFMFVPVATTNAGACVFGIQATLSATTLEGSSINSVMDAIGFKYRVSNGTGSDSTTVSREDTLASIIDSNNDDSEYGSSSSNPGTIGYYHCYVGVLDVTTAIAGIGYVTLIQDVEFSRRVEVASS
jgi:hypothetical protein